MINSNGDVNLPGGQLRWAGPWETCPTPLPFWTRACLVPPHPPLAALGLSRPWAPDGVGFEGGSPNPCTKWFGWLPVVSSQRAGFRELPVSPSSICKEGHFTRNVPPPTNPGVRWSHPSRDCHALHKRTPSSPIPINPNPRP